MENLPFHRAKLNLPGNYRPKWDRAHGAVRRDTTPLPAGGGSDNSALTTRRLDQTTARGAPIYIHPTGCLAQMVGASEFSSLARHHSHAGTGATSFVTVKKYFTGCRFINAHPSMEDKERAIAQSMRR